MQGPHQSLRGSEGVLEQTLGPGPSCRGAPIPGSGFPTLLTTDHAGEGHIPERGSGQLARGSPQRHYMGELREVFQGPSQHCWGFCEIGVKVNFGDKQE